MKERQILQNLSYHCISVSTFYAVYASVAYFEPPPPKKKN